MTELFGCALFWSHPEWYIAARLEYHMLLITQLNKSLMRSKVTNFLIDICWIRILLCSEISTFHIFYSQRVFSPSIIPTGMIKQKYEINTGMKILKDVGIVLKL